MIYQVNAQEDIDKVFGYIGQNFYESLYLYLDLKKYGVGNKNVNSWIQYEDEMITSVALKYHTGFHIYSENKEFNVDEMLMLIKQESPTIICAHPDIIENLSMGLDSYIEEKGYVAKYNGGDMFDQIDANIVLAKEENYDEMAKMLLADEDIGASYTLLEMKTQISERIDDGYSRSYCMYCRDKMVAQISTGAEVENVATVAYVIVAPDARGNGYGKEIVKYMSHRLVDEGFDVFLIYYSEEASRLYKDIGYVDVTPYSKLYRICDV